MTGHASENIVEHDDGIVDMGSFVEHDALGPLAHRCISNFCSRRLAGASKLVEDFSCPDDREVGGLTEPEDLFLYFGKALVTDLDGQVSPGDHDSNEW